MRIYYVRKLTLPGILKSRLDELSAASGARYSQVLTTFWRILRRSAGKRKGHRRKAVFLSSGTLQKLFSKDPAGLLHSHSCDAVVDAFIASMDSARTRKKTDPKARFPRRRKRFFKVTFKSSAIRVRDGQLILSTGDRAHLKAITSDIGTDFRSADLDGLCAAQERARRKIGSRP